MLCADFLDWPSSDGEGYARHAVPADGSACWPNHQPTSHVTAALESVSEGLEIASGVYSGARGLSRKNEVRAAPVTATSKYNSSVSGAVGITAQSLS